MAGRDTLAGRAVSGIELDDLLGARERTEARLARRFSFPQERPLRSLAPCRSLARCRREDDAGKLRIARLSASAFLLCLSFLAFPGFAADALLGGGREIRPGNVMSDSVQPRGTAIYVVDVGRTGGTLHFEIRFEPAGGHGLCGVRISQSQEKSRVRLHQSSSGRATYKAAIGGVVGPIHIEIYSTGPHCNFTLYVE